MTIYNNNFEKCIDAWSINIPLDTLNEFIKFSSNDFWKEVIVVLENKEYILNSFKL